MSSSSPTSTPPRTASVGGSSATSTRWSRPSASGRSSRAIAGRSTAGSRSSADGRRRRLPGRALATKGMRELDDGVAQFTADTGATAEEAKAARAAINEMSSRNLQPVKEIGAALAKVRTDMGLTGKEAEQTTEAFLHFATATGQ